MSFALVKVRGTHGTISSISFVSRSAQHWYRSSPTGRAEQASRSASTLGTDVTE